MDRPTPEAVEREAKFFISSLGKLSAQITDLGGSLKKTKVFETNLRFDTIDQRLAGAFEVLRLRKDNRARLTFKGPRDPCSRIQVRKELEIEISNFETAQRILEALGFSVSVIYEKFRTTYNLENVEIMLDEMPYGDFIEIEGPDSLSIRSIAEKLCLCWDRQAGTSYLGIFETLKRNSGMTCRDLTFENFNGKTINPHDLELRWADIA